MLTYLIKRVLVFIPTLLAVSLLAFGLSKIAPGDPVELLLRSGSGPMEGNLLDSERVYRETAELLGLDKPTFYFSLSSRAFPGTLYRITDRDHRSTLRKITARYGNWPQISNYFNHLRSLDARFRNLPDTLAPTTVGDVRKDIKQLYLSHNEAVIDTLLERIRKNTAADPDLMRINGNVVSMLSGAFEKVKTESRREWLYIPDVKWHGFDNQYHNWFARFIKGNLGFSYIDGRPVAGKIKSALRWTLLMNGLAIFLAYFFSIPLGVYTAVHQGSRFDRISTLALFMLYSLPTFWIATLLVVFITTPEYGMDFFPTMGIGETSQDVPFTERFRDRVYHLVLPVFCLTYGSLAFITRQMRGGMIESLKMDYIRTARAKGLGKNKVIWKHAFRNSLFPVITLFASVFPAILAGSVVIEVIFNIPGMGKLTIDAINQRDWPVVYSILMLSAVLTMTGILIADVLYALADPRVRYRA